MCGCAIDGVGRGALQSALGSSCDLLCGDAAHIANGIGRDCIGIRVKKNSCGVGALESQKMGKGHL